MAGRAPSSSVALAAVAALVLIGCSHSDPEQREAGASPGYSETPAAAPPSSTIAPDDDGALAEGRARIVGSMFQGVDLSAEFAETQRFFPHHDVATDSPMPVTALVQQLYRRLVAEGHDDKGQIGLMHLYRGDQPL